MVGVVNRLATDSGKAVTPCLFVADKWGRYFYESIKKCSTVEKKGSLGKRFIGCTAASSAEFPAAIAAAMLRGR